MGAAAGQKLEMPQPVRLRRLEEREYRRFGPRICPGGDMYRQHLDFMAWAAAYDEGGEDMRSRAMHDAWSSWWQLCGPPAHRCRAPGEISHLLHPFFNKPSHWRGKITI